MAKKPDRSETRSQSNACERIHQTRRWTHFRKRKKNVWNSHPDNPYEVNLNEETFLSDLTESFCITFCRKAREFFLDEIKDFIFMKARHLNHSKILQMPIGQVAIRLTGYRASATTRPQHQREVLSEDLLNQFSFKKG